MCVPSQVAKSLLGSRQLTSDCSFKWWKETERVSQSLNKGTNPTPQRLFLHNLISKPLLLTPSVPGIRISPYELEGWRCKHSESTTMGMCGRLTKDYADSNPSPSPSALSATEERRLSSPPETYVVRKNQEQAEQEGIPLGTTFCCRHAPHLSEPQHILQSKSLCFAFLFLWVESFFIMSGKCYNPPHHGASPYKSKLREDSKSPMMPVGKAAVTHIGSLEVHFGTVSFHPWRATGYRFAHGCLGQKCMLKTASICYL